MTGSESAAPPGRGNLLLEAMPIDAGPLALEHTTLEAGQVLHAPGELISDVYFVETGIIFILGSDGAGWHLEIGTIGFEGMTGFELLLGGKVAAHEALVQSAGSALRLSAAALREATTRSRSLNNLLLRFAHAFMIQTSHAAIAAGRASLEVRLARTLLMWQDRAREERWCVTHDFLAMLLGVYRPSATLAIQHLEGKRLIRAARNSIRILDRAGLERVANGFYGGPEEAYRSLFREGGGGTAGRSVAALNAPAKLLISPAAERPGHPVGSEPLAVTRSGLANPRANARRRTFPR